MSEPMRVVVADDEPLARRRMLRLLRDHDDEVDVVAVCETGAHAVEAIRETRPDLVFLDVQMPEMDGFQVIEAVGIEQMPAVVFVTAYDAYAIRAFDVHAVDYLLKPFDRERFLQALDHARSQLLGVPRNLGAQLRALLHEHLGGRKHLERLVIRSGGRIFFLEVAAVDWIEAADNYAELHVGKQSHLVRHTLASLEARLDPEHFVRIRHSTIVNVRKVKELRPSSSGEYDVVLQSGAVLESSRRYRKKLAAILED
jgi:two-component system LytT family response regulator